jgi:hypothetical protein
LRDCQQAQIHENQGLHSWSAACQTWNGKVQLFIGVDEVVRHNSLMRKQKGQSAQEKLRLGTARLCDRYWPLRQAGRRQVTKTLARISDEFRRERDLDDLVDTELALVNRGCVAEGSLTLAQFADAYWLPTIKVKRRASTHKFYRELFDNHLRARVGDVKLREFETVHSQRVLDDVDLSHSRVV